MNEFLAQNATESQSESRENTLNFIFDDIRNDVSRTLSEYRDFLQEYAESMLTLRNRQLELEQTAENWNVSVIILGYLNNLFLK